MTTHDKDLSEVRSCIASLPPRERQLASLITLLAEGVIDELVCTGGCRPFYTAGEWRARGEQYGLSADLILVHDGGDFYELCSPDSYSVLVDRFFRLADEAGLFIEACTHWYSAIYTPPPDKEIDANSTV